ncbi:MAG: hypothetical protein WD766_01695 [Gemmatimonadota bacterium]
MPEVAKHAASPQTATRLRQRLAVAALGAGMLLGGCNGEDEAAPAAVEPEYEGLSREQIEADATPMTPEEAERLGIVDTMIRLQPPMNPDSVVPLDSAVIQ